MRQGWAQRYLLCRNTAGPPCRRVATPAQMVAPIARQDKGWGVIQPYPLALLGLSFWVWGARAGPTPGPGPAGSRGQLGSRGRADARGRRREGVGASGAADDAADHHPITRPGRPRFPLAPRVAGANVPKCLGSCAGRCVTSPNGPSSQRRARPPRTALPAAEGLPTTRRVVEGLPTTRRRRRHTCVTSCVSCVT